MIEAYPLHWPAGWDRTKRPEISRFNCTLAETRDNLFHQIRLMGGRYPVLSTNIELRRDGLPYASRREPEDSGAAVYFEWEGKQMSFACDRWDRVKDNIRAIEKTIDSIRGMNRWGASDMMERAFSAFTALPAPGATLHWSELLGVDHTATQDEIKSAFRRKAKLVHSDAGGTDAQMIELNVARDEALQQANS